GGLAGRGPVTMQGHTVLDGREPPGQPLSHRAAVRVVVGHVDEVLLAEAPFRLAARGQWLRYKRRHTGGLAGQDFFTFIIPPVRDDLEVVVTHRGLRV